MKYVRGRLVLTNLGEKLAKHYRAGKIGDAAASLVARLAKMDQDKVMKELDRHWDGSMDFEDCKVWIENNIWSPIERQPWLVNERLMKIVGPCKECQPNVATLFGPVKEGACTSLACWERKMTAYIGHLAGQGAVKTSDHYGETPKGIFRNGQFSECGKSADRDL